MKTKATILSLLVLVLAFTGCGKEEAVKEEVLRKVIYTNVEESKATTERLFSGTVKGATEANISFRVNGNLMNKYVGLGSTVTKGEVLAVLDSANYQINLAESKATLAEAKANATKTAADFRRYRELFLNDNASKAEFDNAKAAYQAALARVEATNEKVQYAKLQLSYTKLVAPYSGTIAVEFADESENLGAGSPVFTLVREETPEVQIFLPEDFTNVISIGSNVDVSITAFDGQKFTGIVKEIGSGITGLGNTFPVKIAISGKTTDIKTGMTAEATLALNNPNAGKTIIPLNAVSEGGDNNRFVYVIGSVEGDEGTLTKTEVTLGELNGTDIEVLGGLDTGDKIVTAGVNYVYDGQKVKISDKN